MIQDIKQPIKRRNADYKLLDALKPFIQGTDNDLNNTCGNIQNVFQEFNRDNNGEWNYKTKYGPDNQDAFYNLVSAPMLLARLVSAGFKPIVEGQDGYKVTWIMVLKHEPTGCILTFYDYKGASSYGSCMAGLENKAFQRDVLKVLKALMNPRFPHPYDGCVVGEIA